MPDPFFPVPTVFDFPLIGAVSALPSLKVPDIECSVCDNVLRAPFHHGKEMIVSGENFVCQACDYSLALPKCCGAPMSLKQIQAQPLNAGQQTQPSLEESSVEEQGFDDE